jgi:hypothetical protein
MRPAHGPHARQGGSGSPARVSPATGPIRTRQRRCPPSLGAVPGRGRRAPRRQLRRAQSLLLNALDLRVSWDGCCRTDRAQMRIQPASSLPLTGAAENRPCQTCSPAFSHYGMLQGVSWANAAARSRAAGYLPAAQRPQSPRRLPRRRRRHALWLVIIDIEDKRTHERRGTPGPPACSTALRSLIAGASPPTAHCYPDGSHVRAAGVSPPCTRSSGTART